MRTSEDHENRPDIPTTPIYTDSDEPAAYVADYQVPPDYQVPRFPQGREDGWLHCSRPLDPERDHHAEEREDRWEQWRRANPKEPA